MVELQWEWRVLGMMPGYRDEVDEMGVEDVGD
jgi:hypothetical protein